MALQAGCGLAGQRLNTLGKPCLEASKGVRKSSDSQTDSHPVPFSKKEGLAQ